MVEIYLEKENKNLKHEIKKDTELNKILKELNITIESIILVKNGEICLEDDFVNNDDKIQILSVVSGG